MHSAPFWRLADKMGFVVGSLIIMSFSYIIGKFPNDFFYSYYSVLMIGLIALRVAHFWSQGWHYYISDYCYYCNVLILYLVMYDSHNVELIKSCFLLSQGAVAFSIKLFRNSLVLHKIDVLTSFGIHFCPMIIMFHIKWFTVIDQTGLPQEQQRFAELPPEDSWG